MPEEDLFKNGEEKPESETDDVLTKKIEELKGKSVDDLAKKGAHADQFIEFLKEQNEGLKEELAKRVNAEKLLYELRAEREKKAEAPKGEDSPGLDPEDLNTLIEQNINKFNEKKSVEANVRSVDAKVREVYGEKAKEFVEQKAKELGISLTMLGEVAAKSPNAFYQLVGMDGKASSNNTAPSESTVNVSALNRNNSLTPGTHRYYMELRKTDPIKFYSPEVQRKVFEDRKRLGEKYYN